MYVSYWLNVVEKWIKHVSSNMVNPLFQYSVWWWNVLQSKMATITGVKCSLICTYVCVHTWVISCFVQISNEVAMFFIWFNLFIFTTILSCLSTDILYYFWNCAPKHVLLQVWNDLLVRWQRAKNMRQFFMSLSFVSYSRKTLKSHGSQQRQHRLQWYH